jgi:hypothetical protein
LGSIDRNKQQQNNLQAGISKSADHIIWMWVSFILLKMLADVSK